MLGCTYGVAIIKVIDSKDQIVTDNWFTMLMKKKKKTPDKEIEQVWESFRPDEHLALYVCILLVVYSVSAASADSFHGCGGFVEVNSSTQIPYGFGFVDRKMLFVEKPDLDFLDLLFLTNELNLSYWRSVYEICKKLSFYIFQLYLVCIWLFFLLHFSYHGHEPQLICRPVRLLSKEPKSCIK